MRFCANKRWFQLVRQTKLSHPVFRPSCLGKHLSLPHSIFSLFPRLCLSLFCYLMLASSSCTSLPLSVSTFTLVREKTRAPRSRVINELAIQSKACKTQSISSVLLFNCAKSVGSCFYTDPLRQDL